MLTGILLGAVLILLGLILYIDLRKDKEIKIALGKARDLIVELDARVKKLEKQDFS